MSEAGPNAAAALFAAADAAGEAAGGLARRHQIHGVQPVLPVADVAAAVRWFVDVIGLEPDFITDETPPRHARVRCGDGSWGQPVYIHLARHDAEADGPLQTAEVRLHLGHDVDGYCAAVSAAGAQVVAPPEDMPWGLRECVLQTPDGHVLVFGAERTAPAASGDACAPGDGSAA